VGLVDEGRKVLGGSDELPACLRMALTYTNPPPSNKDKGEKNVGPPGHLFDRNFDPPGVAHYSDPRSIVESRQRLKKMMAHCLDVHFGLAGVAYYSAPGYRKTLAHYLGGLNRWIGRVLETVPS